MLVDAAGDRPGRALGTNGVCGNLGVAVAPVADGRAGRAVRLAVGIHPAGPGVLCLGAAWLRVPALERGRTAAPRPFPAIPPPWCAAP